MSSYVYFRGVTVTLPTNSIKYSYDSITYFNNTDYPGESLLIQPTIGATDALTSFIFTYKKISPFITRPLMILYKNGVMELPASTAALITSGGIQTVITKEYLQTITDQPLKTTNNVQFE